MLPTRRTPALVDLSALTILVHGPAKIGKSTFCSKAEMALFIATEAGLKALDVYQVPATTWGAFVTACHEVAEGQHDFRTIVIDTLDSAYVMCQAAVCERHGVEHPSDLADGKGFSLVNAEFARAVKELSLLPYCLFLICRSQERVVETPTGRRTRIVPALPDEARESVLGMVDVILYCDVEEAVGADGVFTSERRLIHTKPTEIYEAGDRTGRLPHEIELDYAEFIKAFGRAKPRASTRRTRKRRTTTKVRRADPGDITAALVDAFERGARASGGNGPRRP